MPRENGSKRELIDTGSDKRYVRQDNEGKFKESDDQGRSLAQDVKREARTTVKLARETAATKSESSSSQQVRFYNSGKYPELK
jgi:hypothetical protein